MTFISNGIQRFHYDCMVGESGFLFTFLNPFIYEDQDFYSHIMTNQNFRRRHI